MMGQDYEGPWKKKKENLKKIKKSVVGRDGKKHVVEQKQGTTN